MAADPDHALRLSALARARELSHLYREIVPRAVLLEGFVHDGERIAFSSFQNGIFRARQQHGPAALSVFTAPPVPGKPAPYDDHLDDAGGFITYHYRNAPPEHPDNRALRTACAMQVPLIYFRGIAPSQYQIVEPAFVVYDDVAARTVRIQVGLPARDTAGAGLVSSEDARREKLTMVVYRTQQARFREDVLRAYRRRCAVCALRETALVDAAHIVEFSQYSNPLSVSTIENGIALCAIHHAAYDRNLMGIDPEGVVHIGERLLHEEDGPMLENGLQHFHGAAILRPRAATDQPDPERLELRFEQFLLAA